MVFQAGKIEEVRNFLGNGVARLMELSILEGLSNCQYEKCLAAFRNHYSGNMQNKTDAYKGIIELLGQLSQETIIDAPRELLRILDCYFE